MWLIAKMAFHEMKSKSLSNDFISFSLVQVCLLFRSTICFAFTHISISMRQTCLYSMAIGWIIINIIALSNKLVHINFAYSLCVKWVDTDNSILFWICVYHTYSSMQNIFKKNHYNRISWWIFNKLWIFLNIRKLELVLFSMALNRLTCFYSG